MQTVTGYSGFSIFALLCYLFLFLGFLSSKRTNKMIHAFMTLLVIMIMWTGGSFAMRIQLWPAVNFWHHVSLLGMTLLVAGYYLFILAFLEEKRNRGAYFWLIFHALLFVFNVFTGLFIPEPIVTVTNGTTQFIYEYTWHICILLLCILPCLFPILTLIYRHCKGNYIVYQQLKPVLLGLLVIVVGHIATTLPMFAGIPLDIMSGPINALFIFYALYKKRLFKMTVLFSRLNYLLFAILLSSVLTYEFITPLQMLLTTRLGIEHNIALIIIAVVFLVCTLLIFACISLLLNRIFVRTEKMQQARIERFSVEINHMLNVGNILQNLSDTIQDLTHIEKLLVFTQQTDGDFRVEFINNPLEEKNFYIKSDHPLLTYFKTNSQYVSLQDFSRTTVYRSMWEKEKQMFEHLKADYFIPMITEDRIAGILLLPEKKDKSPYNPLDLSLIQSVCSICASSLHDATAYERAVDDARKDKLTGLINRKYFFELLDTEFEKYQETALSLCLINLDDFKMYNQLYGVQEGDRALQGVAALLISNLTETSVAARIGGKEFALLLPGYDIHSAKLLMESIASEIGKLNQGASSQIPTQLTVSAGICAVPYMASSAKELFQNAETAVYTVKRSGKNAVQIYSSEIYYQDAPQNKYISGYRENESTIYALTAAIDAKDHYTYQHSQNVMYYATELAKAIGMENDLIEIVKEAALLHDIGKIGIKEDLLNKPQKLSTDEFEVMKGHVENAVNIIRHLPSLDYVIPTVYSHHERYNGLGYPRQLKGEEIPVTGRILCIADSFDAMISSRSYKKALNMEEAIAILESEAGKQFDPKFVYIFIDLLKSNRITICNQPNVPAEDDTPLDAMLSEMDNIVSSEPSSESVTQTAVTPS